MEIFDYQAVLDALVLCAVWFGIYGLAVWSDRNHNSRG